jgi:hypothetical protein
MARATFRANSRSPDRDRSPRQAANRLCPETGTSPRDSVIDFIGLPPENPLKTPAHLAGAALLRALGSSPRPVKPTGIRAAASSLTGTKAAPQEASERTKSLSA